MKLDKEAQEALYGILKTPTEELIKDVVEDMKKDIADLDRQIETFEEIRIKNLFKDTIGQKAEDILKALREEKRELERTISSPPYKGLAPKS